jgi:serine/threonine protein kinase
VTADRDSLFLQAALHKELLSPEEGQEAVAEARRSGEDVGQVLVRQGLITERTRATLIRDVERVSERIPGFSVPPTTADATVDLPGPPPSHPSTVLEPGTVAHPPPGTAPPEEPIPSQVGIYEVQEKLGQGGMGAVYKARDANLHRIVALKVLAPGFATDREAAERFLREARAAARVNHPNVITVHGVGEEQGRLYMALEFLPGGDADQLLTQHGGKLPERLALRVLRDCARGLVAIEGAGLLHRDLKPANIFISADGTAKLADLGLARSQVGDDRMTQTGAIVGTPAFMAPEQARGEVDLDIRTDIYALGASLYSLLTGQPPFSGTSAFVVVSNLLNQPAPDPSLVRPDLTQPTVRLILRAMAKDRDERYPNANAFLAAVEGALEGRITAGSGRMIKAPSKATEPAQGQTVTFDGHGGAPPQPDAMGSWWEQRTTFQKVALVFLVLMLACCCQVLSAAK